MTPTNEPSLEHGMVLAYKPAGMSSAILVSRLKRQLGRRVGHCGTLDRFAEGLMLLLFGSATCFAELFLHADKSYEARFVFGRSTDTLDPTGETVDERSDAEAEEFTARHSERIKELIISMCGIREQRPPLYSALKVEGMRYSDRARQGKTEKPPVRAVHIYESRLLGFGSRSVDVLLSVSGGTYIRSMADFMQDHLDFPVHLGALRRTAVGAFHVDHPGVWHPEDGKSLPHRISIPEFLPSWPCISLDETALRRLQHGQMVPLAEWPRGNFLFVGSQGPAAWAFGEEKAYRYMRVFATGTISG